MEDGCKTEKCKADEQAFLVALYKYMKERRTPIERIPYLGFKQSRYNFLNNFVNKAITLFGMVHSPYTNIT